MVDKIFPPEIKALIKRFQPKAAFISDIQPTNASDCENCGGAEVICVFIATKGPFKAPSSPYGSSGESSHFDPTAGRNGGWWVGTTYSFPCTECKAGKIPLATKQYPTQKAMEGIATKGTGA